MAEAATVIRAGIGVDVENAEIPSSFSWIFKNIPKHLYQIPFE